jgi:HSP20 family molecular chaperone IbpA
MTDKNEKNNKFTPFVDIVDTKDNISVYMDIPGVSSSSIDFFFFYNKLCISGDKIKPYSTIALKEEISYGNFFRCVKIPGRETTKKNIEFKYENGVLALTIKKEKNV